MRYHKCRKCGKMKTLSEMKGITNVCRNCWSPRVKKEYFEDLKEKVKYKPKKVVERTFTLSVYHQGMHRTEGKATPEEVKWNTLSFAESLAPLDFMINKFHKFPLGTRIKVTMEAVKS